MLGVFKTKDNLYDNSQENPSCVAVLHVEDIPHSYYINKMLYNKYFSWHIHMR